MTHPLLIIAIVLSGLAVGWVSRDYVADNEMAAIKAEHAQAVAQELAKARSKEHEYVANLHEASKAYAANQRVLRARVADARGELDSLLDATKTRADAAPAPTAPGGTDGERTAWQLFGACARTLQAVAAEADRLEAKLTGLQDYVEATK